MQNSGIRAGLSQNSPASKKDSFKNFAFWTVVVGCGLFALHSVNIIRDPEGYAQRVAEAEREAAAKAKVAKVLEEAAEAKRARENYNVATLLTACDTVARKSVKNPSSFSSAWSYRELPTSRGVKIYRNFTAINGFGASLDNFYVCEFDALDQKFVGLDFYEGNY